jgi:pimeloyl-ACP methyl ester carboxylesterase
MSASPPMTFVSLDEHGAFVDRQRFEVELSSQEQPTDVFIFSHGWNNNFADGSATYRAVLSAMADVADAEPSLRPDPFRPFPIGIFWPSKAWDDEASRESGNGLNGSALAEAVYDNLSPSRASPAGIRHDVLRVQDLVVKDLLTADEWKEFRGLLRQHSDPASIEDDRSVFEVDAVPAELEGIAGGMASARDIFRNFTYWQMKKRAGIVGQTGVRELIAMIQGRFRTARVHLIGHSFGCKVVLAAVAGPGDKLAQPVQTIVLLQGAVSFEAMAEKVTGTRKPGGYREAVKPDRVDGPIVATHSQMDAACSRAYPLASRFARQTGELEGFLDRYRALGAVGAAGIESGLDHRSMMVNVGGEYGFRGHGVWSVDGGTAPGAFITGHSDIRTPQIAWLIWSAVRRR